MPPEKAEQAILVDMLEFAREVVSFIEGRTRQDLDTTARSSAPSNGLWS